MQEDNDIDRLFRNGLNDPEIPFNEMDWERMERKLETKEKKRIVPIWFITAGSVAAALVIGLFWIFIKSTPAIKESVHQTAGKKQDLPKGILPFNISPEVVLSNDTLIKGKLAEQGSSKLLKDSLMGVIKDISVKPYSPDLKKIRSALSQSQNKLNEQKDLQQSISNAVVRANKNDVFNKPVIAERKNVPSTDNTIVKSNSVLPVETDSSILVRKANALANSVDPLKLSNQAEIARTVKKKMDDALNKRPGLILSAMAAPDISTTKQSKSSKLSSNFGMLATYSLSNKISLTSGAVYAKKFYNSGGITPGSYANAGTEWEVKANCDVIDIPLNINYKLLNFKKMSVSVNTGLSSYFMLKEKYEFISGQEGEGQAISTLEVTNQNRHLLGIANVSVTFDRQISQSVSIGVQPFAKLPLTGIGNGDVNLKSTGLSFSLNIGLFPARKPGKYALLQ